MQFLFLIGRLILGGYYLYNAFNHFTKVEAMAGYTASKNVPAPKLGILFTGLLLLIAGATMILGWHTRIGVTAIVLFFILVNAMIHKFWEIKEPQARMMERINFQKNLALLGSALMFLMIPRPWPLHLFK